MSETCRLLLVEGDRDFSLIVQGQLSASARERWTCEVVAEIAAALDALETSPPDVVLLDLGTEASGGLPGLRQLLERAPGVPVVVLTGRDDDATGLAALSAGAQDYLMKRQVAGDALVRALRHAVTRGRLLAALRESELRYRELYDGSLGFLCVHDLDGRIISANLTACGALGYSRPQLEGRLMSEFVEQPAGDEFARYLKRVQAQSFDTGLMKLRGRSGDARIWEYRNVLKHPPGGRPFVIGHAVDVTERVRASRERRAESIRDELTGCFNRRYLDERARDSSFGPAWGCVVANLIGFKEVNTRLGTAAADILLVRTGRFLGSAVRAVDAVVRLHADHFVILLNGVQNGETRIVVDRLTTGSVHQMPHPMSLGWAERDEREPLHATVARAERDMTALRTEPPSHAEWRTRRPVGPGSGAGPEAP